ncbi:fumarylacetoacetate hydrolase family protein [Metallosphaera javensis (ex Sakai et al. 2022)]|uniref:fumarylacetoacetate hydrolase family protein n=1 Tax=Metallosphaera javensis (ex Sakai et al. 2022) TaxID=2775498 RepID=UPI00258EFEC4|nr:MAG: 2-hydroxyhepta-2,4-diene-1,7-dioate isomerase [Metallosphaera javensis (ex Sakai et al. 2022)]
MKLVSFIWRGETGTGYLKGDSIVITQGLGGRETGEEVKIDQVKLTAPLIPSAIFCTLVNSPRMLGVEDKREAREMLGSPKFFLKLPQLVIGPGDVILAPQSGVRPEVEIGVIVSKPLKMASREEARNAILGYTVFNDVTAPGEMKEDMYYAYRRDPMDGKVKKMAVRGSHFRNKNRDTFAPMGPWIVTADELGDITGLTMRSIYGDVVVQEGKSDELIYGVEDLLVEVSKVLTVPRLSLISTGTIGYRGAEEASEYKFQALEANLVVEVEKIGKLENPVKVERHHQS